MKPYPRFQKVAAALVGTTLFVSGSFKLMDPVGTGLIFDEYWKLFGMEALAPASLILGLLLSLAESLLGVAMTTGLFRKTVRIAAASLVGFFTLVTLYLAVRNPAMDCGCFGEWIHLSHTASLLKNLVLLALCGVALFPHPEPPSRHPRYLAAGILTAGVLVAMVYCLRGIPPVDYTEFRPGVELAAAQMPERGAGEEVYDAVFTYRKGDRLETFDLDASLEAENDGWTFVSASVQPKRSAREDVVTLSFLDRDDRMADSLAAEGPVMVVSLYDPADLRASAWRETAAFLRKAESAGFRPLLLVAAPLEEVDASLAPLPAEDEAFLRAVSYQADRRKLLALNRDNGGATYFADGMLVVKWGRRSLPSEKKLARILQNDPAEEMMVSSAEGRMVLHGYFLYALAIALLL